MNSNLYRGSLETIVVKLLSDKKRMYGYEISKAVKEMTEERLTITEGALYPILHKLEEQGILEIEIEEVKNRYRKYYRLTEKGVAESLNIIDEMKEYLRIMEVILIPHLKVKSV